MSLARRIAGWREMRVTGAQPERFLTELARRGVPFWSASPPADFSMTVRVDPGRRRAVAAAAAAAGCRAEELSVRGAPRLVRILKRRWPGALVLAVAFVLLAWCQGRVWDIEIEGNETVPDGVILEALAECGVDIGESWLDLNQDAVRNSLILRVPALRWATVTMQGCRARVIVRERIGHEPLMDETRQGDIVAERTGILTEVRALHGTAVKEPGQAVLPGETLIGGFSTGRFGPLGPTWPAGDARARTWYELTAEAPAAVCEKRYTGDAQVKYALILGKKRINFYKDSSICPVGCDKIIKRVQARREGLFILPLAIERIELTPYEVEAVPAPELAEELYAMLAQALRQAVGEDGEITSEVYTSSTSGGVLRAALRAECEEPIGVFAPADEAETQTIQTEETDE